MPIFNLPQYESETQVLQVLTDPALLPTHEESQLRLKNLKKKLFSYSAESIDVFVNAASAHVASQIDCMKCANCCKKLEPDLEPTEIEPLARHKNCDVDTFNNTFTKQDAVTLQRFISTKPCTFLQNNLCTVYASRPKSCSTFPHFDEPGIKFRLTRVLALYHVCPIVYNTIERLHQAVENRVTISPI